MKLPILPRTLALICIGFAIVGVGLSVWRTIGSVSPSQSNQSQTAIARGPNSVSKSGTTVTLSPTPPPPRTLRFHEDVSLGRLIPGDWDAHLGQFDTDNEMEARGEVSIPAGTILWLELAMDLSPSDLAYLRRLKPYDLDQLGMYRSSVTDADMANIEHLTSLRWLDLFQSQVGDEGLIHLKGLQSLQWLDLQGLDITDRGLVHLEGLKSLRRLRLMNTKVTPRGIARLQQALPDCRIDTNFSKATPAPTPRQEPVS